MIIMKKVLIILLSLLSLTTFAQQKKVAVYVTGQESGINKVLGDQLVAGFAQSGKYIAIERTASFLAELGKEQNYQRTGAVDDNELSRLGKQFGVQLVCVADISDVFGQKYISARLIDVESAEVVNTSNTSSQLDSMDELLNVTNKLTKELTSKTVQEKAAEAAAQLQHEEEQKRKKMEQDSIATVREKEEIEQIKQAMEMGYIKIDNFLVMINPRIRDTYYISQRKAYETAEQLDLGGMSGWRLPTLNEIVRIKNESVRLNKIYRSFPNYDGLTFWCAEQRYWHNGDGLYYKTDGTGRARAIYVRSL